MRNPVFYCFKDGWRVGIPFDSLCSLRVNSPMGSHPCKILKTETAPRGCIYFEWLATCLRVGTLFVLGYAK
ncbi:MAG: hypothetical protein KAR44_02295 [Candidatus Aegiribacteria sp.]|nr:hypothetical protein [Candidatus Aegiribacteria sp.]